MDIFITWFQPFICLVLAHMYCLRLYSSYKLIKWGSIKCQVETKCRYQMQSVFFKVFQYREETECPQVTTKECSPSWIGAGSWVLVDLKVMSSRMGLADFREDVECEIHVEGGVGGERLGRTFQHVRKPGTFWELEIVWWNRVCWKEVAGHEPGRMSWSPAVTQPWGPASLRNGRGKH